MAHKALDGGSRHEKRQDQRRGFTAYTVTDPNWVYQIGSVTVLAANPTQAKIAAFEAMAGCTIHDVDQTVLKETLDSFSCVETTPQ